jgi:hypothetical protein
MDIFGSFIRIIVCCSRALNAPMVAIFFKLTYTTYLTHKTVGGLGFFILFASYFHLSLHVARKFVSRSDDDGSPVADCERAGM